MHHQFFVMLLIRSVLTSFSAAITAKTQASRHHQYSLMLDVKLRFQFSRAGQIGFLLSMQLAMQHQFTLMVTLQLELLMI
eukprot:8903972-Karenia_brevis.AAC.1